MRISDWSSDVCSSDLLRQNSAAEGMILADPDEPGTGQRIYPAVADIERQHFIVVEHDTGDRSSHPRERGRRRDRAIEARISRLRTEESRVGNECVSTCRTRGGPCPKKKINYKK